MMNKHFAALTALLLAAALTACSSKPVEQQPMTEPTETAAPLTEALTTESETVSEMPDGDVPDMDTLIQALDHTVWSGVNSDNGAFAVGFSGNAITYGTQDGDLTEGFWEVSKDGILHIYSDESMTEEKRSIPFHYNSEKIVLQLEGTVYMVNTGADSMDAVSAECAALPAASNVYSQQLLNAYWGGGDEHYALIFMLHGDGTCDMHYYDATDDIIDEATFFWGMSSSQICFYNEDFAPVMHFAWNMDGSTFSLTDESSGNHVACTQLPPEEAKDVSYQLGVLAGAYEPGEAVDGSEYIDYEDFDIGEDSD